MIVQILFVNTAFYIYGNIRLKEICILNSFEQIKENIIAGTAFSARLGSSAVAFIPDPYPNSLTDACSKAAFLLLQFLFVLLVLFR